MRCDLDALLRQAVKGDLDPLLRLLQEAGVVLPGQVPNDPDKLLRRKATAEALTNAGYPTSEKTLATKATRGGGPPYQLFGRIPLYRWGSSLAWAQSRLTTPRTNTSASDALKQAES